MINGALLIHDRQPPASQQSCNAPYQRTKGEHGTDISYEWYRTVQELCLKLHVLAFRMLRVPRTTKFLGMLHRYFQQAAAAAAAADADVAAAS